MALNDLICADVPLSNYSLQEWQISIGCLILISQFYKQTCQLSHALLCNSEPLYRLYRGET